MALPVPNLDDRTAQQIVDEAKRRINQYCQEWTDHNVSDPGITLIELFAWMTELLIYRTNQVPTKNYIKFLELLGIKLEAPKAAQAPVTFYLSKAVDTPEKITEGTEVATIRTEANPAIVFTTQETRSIYPTKIKGIYSRRIRDGVANWTSYSALQLEHGQGYEAQVFPGRTRGNETEPPRTDDAFYVAFESEVLDDDDKPCDLSDHVIAISVQCPPTGAGVVNPAELLLWEVSQNRADGGRWGKCIVESDTTGGFNYPGEIILRFPRFDAREEELSRDQNGSVKAYWLRCRLSDKQSNAQGQPFPDAYNRSPILRQLRVESRGITINARHAVTVKNERIGVSDGTAGQRFKLLNTPLLARDAKKCVLKVYRPNGEELATFSEQRDFADTGEKSPVFTLDNLDGALTFGPALPQPDGTVYRFGVIPPKDAVLVFTQYQYGGGRNGNVRPGELSVLKQSNSTIAPYISRVTNHLAAVGGEDAQSLDDAMVRAPRQLRAQERAVTQDDYEVLAREIPGVARAHCVAPGNQSSGRSSPEPGRVDVVVLPKGTIENLRQSPPEDLRRQVRAALNKRKVLGVDLRVTLANGASYLQWVSLDVTLRVTSETTSKRRDEIKRRHSQVNFDVAVDRHQVLTLQLSPVMHLCSLQRCIALSRFIL